MTPLCDPRTNPEVCRHMYNTREAEPDPTDPKTGQPRVRVRVNRGRARGPIAPGGPDPRGLNPKNPIPIRTGRRSPHMSPDPDLPRNPDAPHEPRSRADTTRKTPYFTTS